MLRLAWKLGFDAIFRKDGLEVYGPLLAIPSVRTAPLCGQPHLESTQISFFHLRPPHPVDFCAFIGFPCLLLTDHGES